MEIDLIKWIAYAIFNNRWEGTMEKLKKYRVYQVSKQTEYTEVEALGKDEAMDLAQKQGEWKPCYDAEYIDSYVEDVTKGG